MRPLPALGLPDEALLDQVAAQLDLREPNREAIEVLALRMHQWYQRDRDTFFEGVIDSATGVGKTFIMSGSIDYFTALGVRNFAVIAPGATILNKTIDQFSQGPKSLLGPMSTRPKVITAENFRSSEVANALADEDQVKLYVFTVQSLLKPTTKVGRRTHKFQEGLGGAFYEHLDSLQDLIVFADEHHTYFGPAFSKAVRDLNPLALVGLTGTPHAKTPTDQIIFRYPLTAAIAEKFVKTPVLVGRTDDRNDERTQLLDGATLLERKERGLRNYCEAHSIEFIHPIMLVNCRDIEHASETVAYLTSDQFKDGAYSGQGAVLEVHSDQADKSLEALDHVEEPGNACRIIVQVGMLKEGWDVKNVYVIVSLRASVSEILTEQTLGRGLRLPFGKYTEMPFLNELDVVAHERYEELLRRTETLREDFIDSRTVIERFTNTDNETEIAVHTEEVDLPVVNQLETTEAAQERDAVGEPNHPDAEGSASVRIDTVDDRVATASRAADEVPMVPDSSAGKILVPVVHTIPIPQEFRLAQITDLSRFRELGRRLAVEPEEHLRRTKLGGEVKSTGDGRVAEVTTGKALERVEATHTIDDIETAKDKVIKAIMSDSMITHKSGEKQNTRRLLDAVLEGAGAKADILLSSYGDTLASRVVKEIHDAKRDLPSALQTTVDVRLKPFEPVRMRRARTSGDRVGGKFERGLAYIGWDKGLFEQAWFDSSPERDAANMLDNADEIEVWARIERGDLPILWDGADRTYTPDLLAIDTNGGHWVIEVKSDRDLPTKEVQEKRNAAVTWANSVTADTNVKWEYLLVAERDLADAKGSWNRLRSITSV